MKKFIVTFLTLMVVFTTLFGMAMTCSAEEINPTYKVTASNLNVRTGASLDSKKIGLLPYGSKINPISISDGWAKINYNGKIAYVSADYIEEYVPTYTNGLSDNSSDYLIIINPHYNSLDIYYGGTILKELQCATGKASTPSPQGQFQIVNKIVKPAYKGKLSGSKDNPLGQRWMGLSVPGTGGSKYGIHGTNEEDSIGTNASHGCIRMHNAEVEEIFEFMPVGTTVIICDSESSDIDSAASYGITIK